MRYLSDGIGIGPLTIRTLSWPDIKVLCHHLLIHNDPGPELHRTALVKIHIVLNIARYFDLPVPMLYERLPVPSPPGTVGKGGGVKIKVYTPLWVNSVPLLCTTRSVPRSVPWCTINAPAAFPWCTINAPAVFAWCTNQFLHKVEFSYIEWNGVHTLWHLTPQPHPHPLSPPPPPKKTNLHPSHQEVMF